MIGTVLWHAVFEFLVLSYRILWYSTGIEVKKCVFFLLKVRHHESVKIHSEDPTRGRVEGSEGGQVPEKYIVVRNNDLLHIRYRTNIITSNVSKKFTFILLRIRNQCVGPGVTDLQIQIRSSVCGMRSFSGWFRIRI
jgi:hypothetical protein